MLALALALLAAPGGLSGELVHSVHLEAAPREVAQLARYLELRPGEPLTPELVRRAVETIFATGRYEDVQVEANPGPDGIDVTIRPVLAPLLLAVRIEGARGLRGVTGLKRGESLWPRRLEAAGAELRKRLQARGYLAAAVEARVERLPEGADAVFRVSPGVLHRVSGVETEGPVELTDLTAPRAGQPFVRERAVRAAEQMRRRLVLQGRWAAEVVVADSADPATGAVQLRFVVRPGPLLRVEFRGEGVAPGLQGQVVNLVREGQVKDDAIEEAADRIETALRRRGHRQARVRTVREPRPWGEALVFEVTPGPRQVVGSVRLLGDPVPLDTLALASRAPEPLRDDVLSADATRLRRALEQRGHAEARVEVEAPEEDADAGVVFRAHAGPATQVASLEIETPIPVPRSEAPHELRLRKGVPYRVADLAQDRASLLSAFRNAGHLQAEVIPEVEFSDDHREARVTLRVVPGPLTEVEHVVVAGLERTRETVVRRAIALREGEPLGLSRVLDSQRELGALGLFDRVSIAELDPDSPERRSVVVSLHEAPVTTYAYGIGYAERDKLRGSVEVSRRNLFGMDRSLSLFGRASFAGERALLTYREPFLLHRKQELFLTLYREQESRDLYDFRRTGATAQAVFGLSQRASLIARYVVQETSYSDFGQPCTEVDRQFCPSTTSGPALSVVRDTRDDPLDPHRGLFVGSDLQLSVRALGGDGFLKGFLQVSAYRRLHARTVLAASGRLGLGRAFGSSDPGLSAAERFYAGGDNSLRGFPLDGVLPDGGNGLLLGSAEIRFSMTRYVSIASFLDTGNVYPLVSDLSLSDLRTTAGLGLRYRTAFGPLRLDWGYKLDRRAGEKPYQVHVTVGHAF
jgi:outer membrane protein insertion porin family